MSDVFLLSCKIYGQQYVGSTTDRFQVRRNNYKVNDRKAQQGEEQMKLFEYFHSEEHNGF